VKGDVIVDVVLVGLDGEGNKTGGDSAGSTSDCMHFYNWINGGYDYRRIKEPWGATCRK